MLLEHVFLKAAFDAILKVALAAIELEHKEENVSCGPDCIALDWWSIVSKVSLNNMLFENVFLKIAFEIILKVELAPIELEQKEENVSCGPDCIALD